jgi:hypothetical protein
VFRRFAEQAQGDAQAVAAMLEEDSDEEEGGIDFALDRGELEPEGIVCMVARPFPGDYMEGATIH